MQRWRWWQVLIVCIGYVGAVLGATLWLLTARAEATTRRAGMPVNDLYVIFPRPTAWWVALLSLPPVLLLATQLRKRRRS